MLKRASAKTRRPMATDNQSSFQRAFKTACSGALIAMSDMSDALMFEILLSLGFRRAPASAECAGNKTAKIAALQSNGILKLGTFRHDHSCTKRAFGIFWFERRLAGIALKRLFLH